MHKIEKKIQITVIYLCLISYLHYDLKLKTMKALLFLGGKWKYWLPAMMMNDDTYICRSNTPSFGFKIKSTHSKTFMLIFLSLEMFIVKKLFLQNLQNVNKYIHNEVFAHSQISFWCPITWLGYSLICIRQHITWLVHSHLYIWHPITYLAHSQICHLCPLEHVNRSVSTQLYHYRVF